MGFWIYICIMNLLIPLTMIGLGSYYSKKAPKKINLFFGYRTSMSMKNKDTWQFAHNFFGKLWRLFGSLLFPFTIISMLLLIKKDVDVIGIFGGIICGAQLLVMIIPIFITEYNLKKTFDKNGNRK